MGTIIHEFHLEDPEEIGVYRSKPGSPSATRIFLRDGFTPMLVIVIPDGEILDTLAQKLMLLSLATKDLYTKEEFHDLDY